MPLERIIKVGQFSTIAIWKITEKKSEIEELLGDKLLEPSKKLNPTESVGIHWFASRVLLQQIFEDSNFEIHKDSFNKPYLKVNGNPYFISITHSFEYAAIFVCPHLETGIDLEKIDERVNRVSHKYMNNEENAYSSNNTTLYRTLIWSCKETLYKVYGRKSMDFKEHMLIHPFEIKEQGLIHGSILKSDSPALLDIKYEIFNGYVLTYALHLEE
jgi:phosphopantetheinyl transferase